MSEILRSILYDIAQIKSKNTNRYGADCPSSNSSSYPPITIAHNVCVGDLKNKHNTQANRNKECI